MNPSLSQGKVFATMKKFVFINETTQPAAIFPIRTSLITTVSSDGMPSTEVSHLSMLTASANRPTLVSRGIGQLWVAAEMKPTQNNDSNEVKVYGGAVTCASTEE